MTAFRPPLPREARDAVAEMIIGTLFVNASAGAQTSDALRAASFDIEAVRAAKPPVIDGLIGEDEWAGAALATSFIQYEPRRGDPSDVRTEALMLHDASRLYVAFRAWDTEPITAQLTQRDTDLLRDDAVAVVIDTTFDRRSGYYFITNALGTQADGRIAEDGRGSDSSWDAPWQSIALLRTMDGQRSSASRCRQFGTWPARNARGASTSGAAVAERWS